MTDETLVAGLQKMSIKELRQLADSVRIIGYGKLSKTELAEAVADKLNGDIFAAAAVPDPLFGRSSPPTVSDHAASTPTKLIEAHNEIHPGAVVEKHPEAIVVAAAEPHWPAGVGVCPDVPLEEISWRIDSKPKNNRARYISYIDARTASKTLDRWLGPDGWEEAYEPGEIAGAPVLWCHLTLHFPGRSVVHSDLSTYKKGRGGDDEVKLATGVKGIVSDSFKRAAAKAGVGRNVYELPELFGPVNDKGYPPDNIAETLVAELKKHGVEAPEPRVDRHVSADDAVADEDVDWTRWTKNQIYGNLDRDGAAAERFYGEALRRTGIPEPIESEDAAARVVAAATTLAAAEPPNGEAQTPGPVPPPAEAEPTAPDVAVNLWLAADHEPDDPAWSYHVQAKRALVLHTNGDVPSAVALWQTMTEGMETPLSRDDYHVLTDGLKA